MELDSDEAAAVAHAPGKLVTAEDLLAMGDVGRCELIDGELIRMSPAGFEHGWIAMRIGRLLADHVERHASGIALAAETGYRIRRDPDTVRAPDASFIPNEHLPDPLPRRGFFPGAPDFAVEVVSPEDTWSNVIDKAKDWIDAGCGLVWIIDPYTRSVTTCSASGTFTLLHPGETANADPIVPGFRVPVADLFAGIPHQ